ncbi:hypothetical protein Btru_029384, partial [Bulinus truncatus]
YCSCRCFISTDAQSLDDPKTTLGKHLIKLQRTMPRYGDAQYPPCNAQRLTCKGIDVSIRRELQTEGRENVGHDQFLEIEKKRTYRNPNRFLRDVQRKRSSQWVEE